MDNKARMYPNEVPMKDIQSTQLIEAWERGWKNREEELNKLIPDKRWSLGLTNEMLEHGTINIKAWIVFLDYDGKTLKYIEKKCRMLQKQWSLGNAYIFKTGQNKWHAWFLDMIESRAVIWRILEKSGCDKKYLKMGRRRGSLNIRIGNKNGRIIEYKKTLFNMGKRKISYLLFDTMFKQRHVQALRDIAGKEKKERKKIIDNLDSLFQFGYALRPVVYVTNQHETVLDEHKQWKEQGFTLGKDIHGNRLRSRV